MEETYRQESVWGKTSTEKETVQVNDKEQQQTETSEESESVSENHTMVGSTVMNPFASLVNILIFDFF